MKNKFKGLQVESDKPRKPFPIAECVFALAFIIGLLWIADSNGYIDLVKYLKP